MEVDNKNVQITLKEENAEIFSEKKGILYYILTLIFFNFSYFFVKFNQFIKPDYNIYVYMSVRFFLLGVMNHYLDQPHTKITVDKISNKSIYFRSISLFLDFYLWMVSLKYLRYSTVQFILLLSPIIMSIFTYLFLEEPYYMRYFFGLIISFIGALIITLNENNDISEQVLLNTSKINTLFGFSVALISTLFSSLQEIFTKILSANFHTYFLNTKLGYHVSILAFVFSLISNDEFLNTFLNPLLFFSTVMSSLFSFVGFHFSLIAYKHIDLNKLLILEYLNPVFAVLFGLFLGDSFFLTDFIGICIILSYNIYNFLFPVAKNK